MNTDLQTWLVPVIGALALALPALVLAVMTNTVASRLRSGDLRQHMQALRRQRARNGAADGAAGAGDQGASGG